MILKRLGKKLTDLGYNWEYVSLSSVEGKNGERYGIMVNTPYTGPYPSHEAMVQQDELTCLEKKRKHISGESRGHYTGYLFWEI